LQSDAPAMKKPRACIHTLPKWGRLPRKTRKRPPILRLHQNEHFARDFLFLTHFEGNDFVAARARRPAEKLRRVDEGPTTIRPRSPMAIRRGPDDQHDANTGPTPDSNYKREPFATPSGKNLSYHAMMFDEGFISLEDGFKPLLLVPRGG